MSKLAYWPKRATTLTGRWTLRLLEWLFWMLACLVAMCGLVVALLSDVFQDQPMQQKPMRKLPIPIRQGSRIFAIMPDDSRVEIEPLAAASQARAWLDVVAGGYVYGETKLPENGLPE